MELNIFGQLLLVLEHGGARKYQSLQHSTVLNWIFLVLGTISNLVYQSVLQCCPVARNNNTGILGAGEESDGI